jgi:acyl-coenzyme A synthetase/AMP-(fatty) acid ligase
VNFATEVVERLPPGARALVALSGDGKRQEWCFGEVASLSARLAGALRAQGLQRGDTVATFVGSRPEWVFAMLACWRIGVAALPLNEQLRPNEVQARLARAGARGVICDERNLAVLQESSFDGLVVVVPDASLFDAAPAPAADLAPDDVALVAFTSGTSGAPKLVRHGQRYLVAQAVQAEHWFGARAGDLCWCTAASGWSKSARNAFVAPWLRGAAALLHDGRFDAAERLDIAARESVSVMCMAPTEYRSIAARGQLQRLPALRHAVAAGEALDAGVIGAWREEVGVEIHDGYGQTETGALVGMPIGAPVRAGAMGLPLPGYKLWIDDGELCLEPESVPTMMLDAPRGPWRTGDRVRQDDDGYFWFEGRADDIIISSGYRIAPSEVEAALATHPAVAESAAVAAPDPLRGAVVRAVVVLKPGYERGQPLVETLQAHVRSVASPYKYPRIVEFVDVLPKTSSGKIRRAALRDVSTAESG